MSFIYSMFPKTDTFTEDIIINVCYFFIPEFHCNKDKESTINDWQDWAGTFDFDRKRFSGKYLFFTKIVSYDGGGGGQNLKCHKFFILKSEKMPTLRIWSPPGPRLKKNLFFCLE